MTGLVRSVCARTLSLPSLPSAVAVDEPGSEAEAVVAEFAEQFSADVTMITPEQRSRLFKGVGDRTFGVVVAMYIADFAPRVRAGLEAWGVASECLGWVGGSVEWDHASEPSSVVFDDFLPA